MRIINIHGGSKSQRRLAESAISWYIKHFLPKVKNLDIDVEITKLKRDTNGLCSETDDRQYDIELNSKLKVFEFVTTIMHEMIHVKQYVRREISDTETGKIRWKSRTYNQNNISYWEHPWEKEAHKYDEAIAYEFMIDTGRW